MLNQKSYYFLLIPLLGLWWMVPCQLYAQENYETVKSALIIQFIQHVDWPDENKIDHFNIGVIGNDSATFQILLRSSEQRKIKNKNYQIHWVKTYQELEGLHVLYMDKSMTNDLILASQAIERKNILLITEQSPDTKNIMLNILLDEKKKRLSFEVNKANIIIENLEMNPELLLLGGTEVDIRELYRDIKKQFEEERIRAEKQKIFMESQVIEIRNQRSKISANEIEINSLKANTEQLTDQITTKEIELSNLSTNITAQKESIQERELQLASQKQLSNKLEHELDSQKSLIALRSKELDSLTREGEIQQATIINQSSTLQSKEEIINLQKKVITIIIACIVIFGVLILVILRYYRLKKVLSVKLEDSYSTLREQHNSILQLNEELNTINEMLEEKVIERTKVLEERNTQLTEYAFINSHLLRAPLSQIQGLSFLLAKENLNVKDKNLLSALSKATDDLDKIIRKISDLLYLGKDFSREEIDQLINRKFNSPSSSGFSDN